MVETLYFFNLCFKWCKQHNMVETLYLIVTPCFKWCKQHNTVETLYLTFTPRFKWCKSHDMMETFIFSIYASKKARAKCEWKLFIFSFRASSSTHACALHSLHQCAPVLNLKVGLWESLNASPSCHTMRHVTNNYFIFLILLVSAWT